MNKKIINVLTIIFLFASLYFYSKYDYKFRHQGENLSQVGGIIIVLTGIRSLFKAYLFVSFIYELKFKKRFNSKIIYLIIGLSFWFSKVSSLDIPLIFLSLILAFNKVSALTSEGKPRYKLFNNLYVRFITISFIAFFIVFMGVANKIGFDKAKEVFTEKESVQFLILNTTLRFSTYYASVYGAFDAYDKNQETIKQALSGTVENTFNRFRYLTNGEKIKRPQYWSVYRCNYKNLFVDNLNPRTGASPGIVASIFYFNNLFFGILFITIYIFFLIKLLKEIFEINSSKLNILGVFISFVFVMPYFESPIDYINIFNPSFIYLYFTFVTFKKMNNDKLH